MCQITGQDREQKIGNGKGQWERNYRPSFRKENTTSKSKQYACHSTFLGKFILKTVVIHYRLRSMAGA